MAIKITCSCGARISIPFDLLISQRDEMAVSFYEAHEHCREAVLMKAHAVDDIAKTLQDIQVVLAEFLDMAQEKNA